MRRVDHKTQPPSNPNTPLVTASLLLVIVSVVLFCVVIGASARIPGTFNIILLLVGFLANFAGAGLGAAGYFVHERGRGPAIVGIFLNLALFIFLMLFMWSGNSFL